ncbi:MAG: putative DNA binding domain-containing protein [Selenomonadaceae bacterium]|nr:putative DNA binding domain-containing protein [Selenomonadaceae bacterium]
MLSLDYMLNEHENKYFDRKSAKIKPSVLAELVAAFANADGGTIVIGITDKSRKLEGINFIGEEALNNLITTPKDCCKPMAQFEYEFLNIKNKDGFQDRLLLLHIKKSVDHIIRTNDDRTYLRIGDRTKELRGVDLVHLEYAKSTRHYEDEINRDATLEDLDTDLLNDYRHRLDADELTAEQVLKARGFIKKVDGKDFLTNAAVLLFAKNIAQFYPNCRIRFLRYEGTAALSGAKINIIRDKSIELPLLRLVEVARDFIVNQLREFTMLDMRSGKFQTVPEYPDFAWLEGIVNAVTHREYAMSGNFIKVSMYDDRLEIESPGRLPNIVTLENIRETRYSRNPRISRVMTEFGWVRELNEGVQRIYNDMADFFLDDPVYSEPGESLRLVLKNNIVMRRMRQEMYALNNVGIATWNQLDNTEQAIMAYILNRGAASRAQLAAYTRKSDNTVRSRLNGLINKKLLKANGSTYDPNRTYEPGLLLT